MEFLENKTVIGSRLSDTEYRLASGTKGESVPVKLLPGQYGMEQYVERKHVLLLERSEAYHLRRQGVVVASSVENPQAFAEDLTGRPITVCPEFPENMTAAWRNF